MPLLVVEEHVGAEAIQEGAFFQAAEEQAFVDAHVPGAQGADHALMGGGAGETASDRLARLRTF